MESYDPRHDKEEWTLPLTWIVGGNHDGLLLKPYYNPPVDRLDAACERHDKCYYSCRASNRCDKTARESCMKQCNLTLGQEAAESGVSGGREWMIETYMDNFGPPNGLVGPNDPSCKCQGSN